MSEQDSTNNLTFCLEPVEAAESRVMPRLGRDEMNLAEFPFALLANRVPDDVNTLKFEDTVEGKDGKLVRRTWTVTGGDHFGLPVAGDEQVYVALMEVTREQGFDQRTISITRYDMIKRLGWPDKGDSYKRLRAALDRLLSVTIKSEKAFWDKAKQRYVDVGFHIIDDYALYDETPGRKGRKSQDPLPLSFVSWNQVIFRSFQAGNIKQLDTAFYFSLQSNLSRRLYRYLDKKRYDGKGAYRIGLKKLAFEKLGMSRNYYPSHIKQELARANAELLEAGFLEDFAYERSSRGEEQVVFHFTRRKHLLRLETPSTDITAELAEEISQLGVTPAIARRLVEEFGEETRVQLQYLPFRRAQDPAAVLVEAIKSKWEPPASYLKARAEEERRLQQAERQTAREQAQAQQAARDELKQMAMQILLGDLPLPERTELLQLAKDAVARQSPPVARRPASKAYEAMLNQQLTVLIAQQYPEALTHTCDKLAAETHIDLNDDL